MERMATRAAGPRRRVRGRIRRRVEGRFPRQAAGIHQRLASMQLYTDDAYVKTRDTSGASRSRTGQHAHTHTQDNMHTHTHTQREREREREIETAHSCSAQAEMQKFSLVKEGREFLRRAARGERREARGEERGVLALMKLTMAAKSGKAKFKFNEGVTHRGITCASAVCNSGAPECVIISSAPWAPARLARPADPAHSSAPLLVRSAGCGGGGATCDARGEFYPTCEISLASS
jgi:hypothetical protein